MTTPKPSKTEEVLNLDFSKAKEDEIWVTSQNTLRILVGVLGVLLPILLYVFLWINTGYNRPLESVSHYYYTRVCGIFIITVSLLAIFLLVYKGKALIDFYLSFFAGIFALCVVLFPTSNITSICSDPEKKYAVTLLVDNEVRFYFHYISAAIFLLCLAFMSLFLFTRSDEPPSKRTPQKKARNRIFRICGVVMILALLVIFAGFLGIIKEPFYSDNQLTFWMEALAVESFGVAWLTKAKVFFKD